MLTIVSNSSNDTIKFLGFEIPITTFLYSMGGLAVLVFLILLSILLIMYLRKRGAIKGYLSLEEKDYQLEDKILEIEHEIAKLQRRFYSSKHVSKKTKKYFK
ncbi:hypothetical protein [Spiroplasma endosymbiont of Polydrusus pterygomalis]|uniref:hypothetical protein n=1 Tax=Spiroplasma endosymbiont of Polydrusus pterygomalis TaxID=3139327 RepID=UPI003CCA80C7